MFKNTIKALIVLFIIFGGLALVGTDTDAASFQHKSGDILYTKSTQCKNDKEKCKGISGHVGIVYAGKVIHIAGKNSKPSEISISKWYSNYPTTKVIRPNNSNIGVKAGKWAKNYYINGKGKNNSYNISKAGRKSVLNNYTYCTQIVWQAYKFGADKGLITGEPIRPAEFEIKAKDNGMKVVRTVGKW